MKKRILVAAAVALGVFALLAAPSSAHGLLHLKLDKSTPEADQVLTTPPDKIVLDFSQKPELAVSRVSLKGPDGDAELSEVKFAEDDDSILWVGVQQPLGDGTYTVNWTTSSSDGHPIRGEFSFTVAVGR